MYKTKIWVWMAMAAIAFVFWGAPKLWDVLNKEATHVTVNIETDDTILNETKSFSINDDYFTFKASGSDSMVLIREKSTEQINGYKKYDNLYYTPIVMFARYEAKEDNSGFKLVDSESTSSPITKDLTVFINAILEEKTFEEIGISKEVASGKVKLYIPQEGSSYYEYVEELFYATLNKGTIPTIKEKETLKKDFDKIMENCVQVEDIQQLLYDTYKNPSKHKEVTIVLGPEKIFVENQYFLGSTSTDAWNIVYPTYTVAKKYDVYVKEIKTTNNDVENTEIITEEDIITLLKSKIFSKSSGLRTTDGSFSFNNDIRSKSIDNLRIIN